MKNIYDYLKNKLSLGNVLSGLGLCILFLLLRWNTVNIPLIRDEGEFAYDAWLMLKNIPPYLKAFSQTPPMTTYTYVLAYWLNPNAFCAPRIISYIFVALATMLLGLIARKEFGRGAGWIAAWVVTPLILFPAIRAFAAKQEKFLLLPLIGVLYAYIFWNKKSSYKQWFIAGLLSAITLLYKPTVLPIILFIFIVQIIETWQYIPELKELFKKIVWGVLGGVLAVIMAFAFYFAHNSLSAFWEGVITYNKYYLDYSGFGWPFFFQYLKLFWAHWWILVLFSAYFFIKRPPRWWFYLGLLISALFSTAGSAYYQYYIPLMPIWALVVTGGIVSLAQDLSQKIKLPAGYLRAGILVMVVFLLIWPSRQKLMLSPLQFQLEYFRGRDYLGGNPFYESPIVAKKVQQITSTDDYVYIAGSEPQILYYARRQSPTRFIWAYPLTQTSMALKYQKEVIQALEMFPPEVIVFVKDNRSWLRDENSPVLIFDYLNSLQQKKYRPIGGFVQTRQGGFWHEPLIAGLYPKSQYSLIVYKKSARADYE
ncbi:MAG: glycosyltransferase family 39 protein [Candidatus Margulisiibacteriota bacterium]